MKIIEKEYNTGLIMLNNLGKKFKFDFDEKDNSNIPNFDSIF